MKTRNTQQGTGQAQSCVKCRGTGQICNDKGEKTTCPYCRGSKTSTGYATK